MISEQKAYCQMCGIEVGNIEDQYADFKEFPICEICYDSFHNYEQYRTYFLRRQEKRPPKIEVIIVK